MRQTAERRLGVLRRRLTLAFGLMSLISLAALATMTTIVDQRLRDARFDTQLQGQASRAAALVFFDDTTGEWNANGAADDVVAQATDALVVFDALNRVELVATADVQEIDPIIERTLADDAEIGVIGTVVVDGQSLSAAGSPYFGFNEETGAEGVVGAVVVAAQPGVDEDHQELLTLVWVMAAVLVILSTSVSWFIAGRVVRPMGAQLDREEAFLATAAHELRTPLGRFQAVAESALLSARRLPHSGTRDAIVTDVHRLLQLNHDTARSIEDLLLLGRIEAGQLTARLELVRLDHLVADFEASIPELAVETSGPVTVLADPALVHHAMSNIFVNAQRHARRPDVSLLIEASVALVGGEAIVTVSDNGPGVSDPIKIFTRHHTTSSSGGLGLWIVRTLVEQQSGTVTALDEPDSGATFELRWPVAPS